jgi:hypothetical protein
MATIEPLIDISEIKTTLLTDPNRKGKVTLTMHYDDVVDALTLLFVPNNQETVVFYMDDYLGVLYLAENLELVGLYIEDVKFGFLQQDEQLESLWNRWEASLESADSLTSVSLPFLELLRGLMATVHNRLTTVAPEFAAVLA